MKHTYNMVHRRIDPRGITSCPMQYTESKSTEAYILKDIYVCIGCTVS